MQDIPLFQAAEKTLSADDFTNALRALGLQTGDVAFVHVDTGVFGKLAPGVNRTSLSNSLITAIETAIPNGTLILPTFTYEFCKTGVFDMSSSKSEVGMLTEFFRNMPGVMRSTHPIFSVAARGQKTTELLDVDMDSFGPHSFFANLHRENGWIVFFGASFERATFAHYIEQAHGVPYRFIKTFKGILRRDGTETPIEATYLVRFLDRTVETYLSRLEEALRKDGTLKQAVVGMGTISAVRASDMYDVGMHMLDEDIHALLKQPPQKIS